MKRRNYCFQWLVPRDAEEDFKNLGVNVDFRLIARLHGDGFPLYSLFWCHFRNFKE